MSITVRITTNYGQRAVYPVCESAKALTALTGRKTFTERDITLIKRLGYTISVEQVSL